MSPAAERRPKLGVVGATGAVGGQVAELLGTRTLDPAAIKLFASGTGASQTVTLGSEEAVVEELTIHTDLSDLDLLILCAPESVNAEVIRRRPCPLIVSIDCLMRESLTVSVAAPGLTSRERLNGLKSAGHIAVPHPAAYAIALVLNALENQPDFVAGTLLLGASAGGRHDVEEMAHQSSELLNARLEEDEEEPQRAFNIVATADDDALAETIVSQAASLLNRPLKLSLAIAHVPIFHGCALSIQTTLTGDFAQLAAGLRSAPGLLLADNANGFSLMDAAGQEAILIRPAMTQAGASFWCLYDNARLAALCAVWIAETLVSVRQLN